MAYLTKSRFTVGIECPTKIRYSDDKSIADARMSDQLLLALAEGGHQVGALAKCLFPSGIEVTESTHEEQLQRTQTLLDGGDVIIFEAAILVGELFIRADILEKKGGELHIYEVKAKSIDPENPEIVGKRGGLLAVFKPKLYDIAFQRHVLKAAFPNKLVRSFLILVNKRAICDEDNLSRRLAIQRQENRIKISIDETLTDGRLAKLLLHTLPVDEFLDQLELQPLESGGYVFSFTEGIRAFTRSLTDDSLPPRLGAHCRRCQFYARRPEDGEDGRRKCMSAAAGLSIDEIELGTAIDLYNCRTIDGLISSGHLLLQSLSPADLNLKESDEEITNSHRQWLQSIEARGELKNGYFIRTEIESTIASLPLPINFLDFETARPVLPFNANKRPYEQLLFQYSLHRLESGLDFRHIAQYLAEPGTEPTLPTLRDLQASLGKNTGPVLHWWDHERTVLNEIRKNLTEAGNRVPDGADLVEFIDSLVGSTKAPGRLYDLGKLVHRCAYYSGTRGRSSLKQVLPAILRTSNAMREKYSRAIYGSEAGLRSSNFENQAWVSANTPDRFDPYILLGDIGPHEALQNVEKFEDDEDFVADGGAAMAAFAMLQNGLLGEAEALQTKKQLLKYCELDTFAMCLAWEHLCEIATL